MRDKLGSKCSRADNAWCFPWWHDDDEMSLSVGADCCVHQLLLALVKCCQNIFPKLSACLRQLNLTKTTSLRVYKLYIQNWMSAEYPWFHVHVDVDVALLHVSWLKIRVALPLASLHFCHINSSIHWRMRKLHFEIKMFTRICVQMDLFFIAIHS